MLSSDDSLEFDWIFRTVAASRERVFIFSPLTYSEWMSGRMMFTWHWWRFLCSFGSIGVTEGSTAGEIVCLTRFNDLVESDSRDLLYGQTRRNGKAWLTFQNESNSELIKISQNFNWTFQNWIESHWLKRGLTIQTYPNSRSRSGWSELRFR